MTEPEHARLAPSSAERWVECPGSVVMQERYPQDEESEASREGTASHWVASETLLNCQKGDPRQDYLNETSPNGVIITEEMIEGAEVYVDDVLETIAKYNGNLSDLHIEERVDISRIHDDNWGTPDCWWFDKIKGVLHVWDYKYGHRIVHPYDNWQMVEYVLGVLAQLFPDTNEPEIMLNIKIVQPRSYHHEGSVRLWQVRPDLLRANVNLLQAAAVEALGEDPSTKSGEWCRDCTGRHVCRTHQQSAMCAVDIIGDLSADELPPEAMGTELLTLRRAAKAVEYRLTALEAQALETIRSGKLIAGWAVEQGKGRQKWDKPKAEVFALGDLMDVELRKDPEPITPKQAIKGGIDAAVIQAYSTVPLTGLKLVPDDGSKAKRVFSQ